MPDITDDHEPVDAVAVVLHATADSLTYDAPTSMPNTRSASTPAATPNAPAPTRQRSAPNASDDDEKPLPSSVRGVPPSDAPITGHTEDTDADAR